MQKDTDYHAHNAVKILLQIANAAAADGITHKIACRGHGGKQGYKKYGACFGLMIRKQYRTQSESRRDVVQTYTKHQLLLVAASQGHAF